MRTLLRLRTLADAVCIVLVRVAQIGQIVVGPPCCLCVPRSGEQRCWQMWVGPVAWQRGHYRLQFSDLVVAGAFGRSGLTVLKYTQISF